MFLEKERNHGIMQLSQSKFDMVTISFVCHQKPHSLQPNQIYGNLVTNIPKY
jgi:hypothetical protein